MQSYIQIFQGIIGIGSWNDFFMVLQDNTLIIQNPKRNEIKYRVSLQVSQIKKGNKGSYSFTLFNGFQDIDFRAKEKILQQKWVLTIQDVIDQLAQKNKEHKIIENIETYWDIEMFESTSKVLSKEHYEKIRKFYDFLLEIKNGVKNQPDTQIQKFIVNSEKLLKAVGESLLYLQYEQKEFKEMCLKMKERIKELNRDQKIKEMSGKKLSIQKLIEDQQVTQEKNDIDSFQDSEEDQVYLSFDSLLETEEQKQGPVFKEFNQTDQSLPLKPLDQIQIKIPQIKNLLQSNIVFNKYPIQDQIQIKWFQLPVQRIIEQKVQFLQILKENFGKDLTKITMPVWLNEPLTITQKAIEVLKYWKQLWKANQNQDQYQRIAYIASNFFIIHSFAINRNKKPFNSLLGETFDFQQEDFKVVSEQVSHHPPIAAYYGESNDFKVYGYSAVQLVFSINGLAIRSTGLTKVYLKKTDETFTILFPDNELKNVLSGNVYVHHVGNLTVINEKTKDQLIVNFPQLGWFEKPNYKSSGFIYNSQKQKLFQFEGDWSQGCDLVNLKTNEKISLIKVDAPIKNPELNYYFNDFSLQMNYLSLDMIEKLPITDCRFRTDLRAYEYGDMELAASEKNWLEEKQWKKWKEMEHQNQHHVPVWFEFNIVKNSVKSFSYKGEYWKHKDSQQWPETLMDLYN